MGLMDMFSNQSAENAAYLKAMSLKQGLNEYKGNAEQGRGAINTSYDKATQPLQQNANNFGGMANQFGGAYSDALGLNGQAGYDKTIQNFQTGPGYDFAMDQGLNALDRRAASRGMLNSGNTNLDTIKFAQGTANQEFGNYLNRLLGGAQLYVPQSNTAAQGYGTLEALRGNQLNQSYTDQGKAALGVHTGIGDAFASQELNNYNVSQNMWKGLMEGGKVAAQAASFLSDRRAKDDIEEIGSLRDGTPVYSFRYKGDNRTQIGLMAQDVETFAPDAVIEVNGMKMVDYRAATERARTMAA